MTSMYTVGERGLWFYSFYVFNPFLKYICWDPQLSSLIMRLKLRQQGQGQSLSHKNDIHHSFTLFLLGPATGSEQLPHSNTDHMV